MVPVQMCQDGYGDFFRMNVRLRFGLLLRLKAAALFVVVVMPGSALLNRRQGLIRILCSPVWTQWRKTGCHFYFPSDPFRMM